METVKKLPIVVVFLLLYFCLGLHSPTKVSYINTTVISYINVLLFYASNFFLAAILFVRSFII